MTTVTDLSFAALLDKSGVPPRQITLSRIAGLFPKPAPIPPVQQSAPHGGAPSSGTNAKPRVHRRPRRVFD